MKKKIGERGKQRQGSTRSRVSRSSTGEAFEDPDGRKGSSAGHPGHAAGEMAPLPGDTLKTPGWEPAVQKRRGKEGGSPAGGWGGTRAAPRAAPCPGHPGTPRCSEPDSVAEQDASNSRRGGAAGSTSPDPPCPSLPSACRPDSASGTWRPRRDHALTRGHQQRTHGASHEHRSREHSGPRESPRSHRRVPAPSSPRPPLPGPEDGESPETPRRLSRGARPPQTPTHRPGAAEAPPTTRKPRPYPPRPDPKWPGPAPTCMTPPPPHPRAAPCHSPFPFGTLRLRQAHG